MFESFEAFSGAKLSDDFAKANTQLSQVRFSYLRIAGVAMRANHFDKNPCTTESRW